MQQHDWSSTCDHVTSALLELHWLPQWRTGHTGIRAMPGGPVCWSKKWAAGLGNNRLTMVLNNCHEKLLLNIKRSVSPVYWNFKSHEKSDKLTCKISMSFGHLRSQCDLSLWLSTSKSNNFVSNCTELVYVLKFSLAHYNIIRYCLYGLISDQMWSRHDLDY